MNVPQSDNKPSDQSGHVDLEQLLQHHILSKAAPYIVAALVSAVGLSGTYFFGTVWGITSRLDRECPTVIKDVQALRDSLSELHKGFAEYPRNYEIRRAIESTESASVYRSADAVAMEEIRKQLYEVRQDMKRCQQLECRGSYVTP